MVELPQTRRRGRSASLESKRRRKRRRASSQWTNRTTVRVAKSPVKTTTIKSICRIKTSTTKDPRARSNSRVMLISVETRKSSSQNRSRRITKSHTTSKRPINRTHFRSGRTQMKALIARSSKSSKKNRFHSQRGTNRFLSSAIRLTSLQLRGSRGSSSKLRPRCQSLRAAVVKAMAATAVGAIRRRKRTR